MQAATHESLTCGRLITKAIIGTSIIATLQGCSVMGTGDSDYSCSGLGEGVRCMSIRDVYGKTHNGNIPRATDAEGRIIENRDQTEVGEKSANETITITDRYVAPDMPNKPVPVRTPAKVMRAWIAPYEDKSGDLFAQSLVFTEIEQRKWLYDSPQQTSVRLTPIQTFEPAPTGNKKQSTTGTVNNNPLTNTTR
jgi:conjugal transfer pilus assembly protein TraV